MIYDKEYFIKKFKAIPDNEIGKGGLANHCALWHCGVRETPAGFYSASPEAAALINLFRPGMDVKDDEPIGQAAEVIWRVNDMASLFPGDTAKGRILNKLKSL